VATTDDDDIEHVSRGTVEGDTFIPVQGVRARLRIAWFYAVRAREEVATAK
jgi:hypothetical protein